jgi:prepilin-type N-terminal cleavage/methylation domain-containing protein
VTKRHGFTLVEMLVAVAILLLVTGVVYGVFSAVTKAWQRGQALTDDLHHGDFVMEQLVMGLRSAHYRGLQDGFILEDHGDSAYSADVISWVKTGPALVGRQTEAAKSLHRVRFTVEEYPDGGRAAAVTFWGDAYLHPEDFDPSDLEPEFLSRRIVGFHCRVATNNPTSGELPWQDTWEDDLGANLNLTNRLPHFVELTLYLDPLKDGEPPVEMKRCVELPVAASSWETRK